MKRFSVLAAISFVLITLQTHADISSALLAYYTFDGTLNDSSGNGYNGTSVNGVSYVASPYGQAAHLNGSSMQYLTLPPSIPSPQDLTVSFWSRTSSSTPNSFPFGIFLVSRDIPDVAYDWNISLTSGRKVDFQAGTSSGDVSLVSPTDLPINVWTEITCVFNSAAATKTIYVNGTQAASASWTPHAFENGSVPIYIGEASGTPELHLATLGDFDELRIYGRALSPSDVAQLVPEPSAAALLLLGAFCLRRRPLTSA